MDFKRCSILKYGNVSYSNTTVKDKKVSKICGVKDCENESIEIIEIKDCDDTSRFVPICEECDTRVHAEVCGKLILKEEYEEGWISKNKENK